MSRRRTNPWWKEELGIPTKAKVEDKIRSIVRSTLPNRPIDEISSEFLKKVLSHHYHYREKCGVGLRHLEVRTNPSWNGPTQGIWIIRDDGTEVDISWVTALMPGGRPSIEQDIRNAARYEVSEQIHEFHDTGECSTCELCHTSMTRHNGLHVDHIKPFKDLFSEFIENRGITYSEIQTEDLGVESQFKDRPLAREWYIFHKENATLRLVHKQCNLGRAR